MMGRRKQEDLEWLIRCNPSPRPAPATGLRFSPPPSSGDHHINNNRMSSSVPVNRSGVQDFNPYYPTTNNYFNPPTYPESNSNLYDVLLASKFNQLNLGGDSAIGRFGSIPAGSSNIPSYFNNNNNEYMNGNDDLQRLRVDSAVRGQIRDFYSDDLFGGGGGGNYREFDSLLTRQQQGYNGNANFHPELGYFFPNKNVSGRNGVIRERSFDTISSSFDRKRQPARQNFSTLEELREKLFSSLEELRGRIFFVAKDQHGCRDLQKILGEAKPEEKDMIFSELKIHVRELMVDQFANYLAQKMFEVCNEEQITELLLLVISDEHNLIAICLDAHGTRAMQKLLAHLTTAEQRSLVISALRRITVTLTKSTNGHHVVEHCLKYFPNEDKMYILSVVVDNCLDIATDKSGCCVLQQCVEHARGEPRDRLISEIIANALILSEHPYGNYVVQFLIGLRIPHITNDILAQLAGNYVSLSMNKYGSNVVEKCMKESPEEQAMQIIQEIIGSQNFLTVLQDPFGNYVAQSAFSLAKGSIRHAMMNLIQMHYSYLHSHPHGKRVLARARGSRQRV